MLSFAGSLRVFLAVEPYDMRKGFEGLHALVCERLRQDLRSGALFVFINKRSLSLRRKLPAAARVPLPRPDRPNQRWSMDFVSDQLADGRRFRCLTLVDDFTRQCLAIHVDTSIGGSTVADLLQSLIEQRGKPAIITTDNGPEFICRALHRWAQAGGVTLNHIQPSKPTQKAFIESFNGTFRDDCLNQHWFNSLPEARLLIEHWRNQYNQLRPHSSIGRILPDAFALKFPLNQPPSPNIQPALA